MQKVHLEIPHDKWEFIKPMLSKYVVSEKHEPSRTTTEQLIDYDQLRELPHGVRISNILRDGLWDDVFTYDGSFRNGKPKYSVITLFDLRRVYKHDFLKHRNAGEKTWEELNEYMKKVFYPLRHKNEGQ